MTTLLSQFACPMQKYRNSEENVATVALTCGNMPVFLCGNYGNHDSYNFACRVGGFYINVRSVGY